MKDAERSGTIAPIENAKAEAAAACKGFGKLSFSITSASLINGGKVNLLY